MIYDAFPFNNELLMLELRLEELNDVVDKFVFIETRRNYRGAPKPLHFAENRDRFSKYLHKIIYHVPENLPNAGAWEYERLQRNVLSDVLIQNGAQKDDVISFSDCDEIPNPQVLKDYRPEMGLRSLKQFTFYYNFNHLMNYGNRSWSRARLGTVGDMLYLTPYEFRLGKRDLDESFPSIENAGWHGSYFNADMATLRQKVHSISHDDMDHIVDGASDSEIARRVVAGEDLYHRSGVSNASWWDTNDPRLPKAFLANPEKYRQFTNAHWEDIYTRLRG